MKLFLFPQQQTMLLLLATTITMMIAKDVGTDGVVAATATESIVTANGDSVTLPTGGTQYPHFIAMNDTMTCVEDNHATPFNTVSYTHLTLPTN